jgi:hypothetical protein
MTMGSEEEEVRDPEAKMASMQEHIDRLHKRVEERDSRIQELEQVQDTSALDAERVRSEFLSAVLRRQDRLDLDTTWDLFNVRGFVDAVTVMDGEVIGMDGALTKVLDRYPWLVDDKLETRSSQPQVASGRPVGGKKRREASASQLDAASLAKRMPALKRR